MYNLAKILYQSVGHSAHRPPLRAEPLIAIDYRYFHASLFKYWCFVHMQLTFWDQPVGLSPNATLTHSGSQCMWPPLRILKNSKSFHHVLFCNIYIYIYIYQISCKEFCRSNNPSLPSWLFLLSFIAQICFQAAIPHTPRQVRWDELHASLVTEWSPACLHK